MLRRRLHAFVLGTACAIVCLPAHAQQSKAAFDAPVVMIDSLHRFDLLLDFDGDGYDDAVGWWCSTDSASEVTAWRNDQTGGFVQAWSVRKTDWPTCNPNTSIHGAAGDLNGDGLDDLVLTALSRVQCYLSDGTTPFVLWREWLQVGGHLPVIADFDGDGLGDLALHDDWNQHVRVFLNRGPELPFEESALFTPYAIDNLSAAEVNGDGLPDLVSWPWPVIPFPVVNGVPTQGDPMYVRNNGALAIGDVDGDGDQDLVHFNDTGYALMRRTAPDHFTIEPSRPGGPATKLMDVDADGDLDGICCAGGGETNYNEYPAVFEITINRGGGDFAPAFRMPSLGSIRIAGASDLDHDGDVDLVGGRCVYYANGPIVDPHPAIESSVVSNSASDADGDGDPDWEFGLDHVWTNLGDGNMISRVPITPPPPPGSTFVGPGIPGDFDSDGDVDLLVERQVNGQTASMRLLRNEGGGALTDGGDAGSFGSFTVIGSGSWLSRVADVDGDGDADVLTRRWVGAVPRDGRIWLNQGTGTFVGGPVFFSEFVVQVARLDADALPDLVTSTLDGDVSLRRGLGNGLFGPPELLYHSIVSGLYARETKVADMDADGDLDVLGIAQPGAIILSNDGNGGFSLARTLFPSGHVDVFAVDVDGDGRRDVVVPSTASTTSFVYRSSGVGFEYAPRVEQMFRGSTLADVDGDGDEDFLSDAVDVVTGGSYLDIESDHFIRNRRFDGPGAGARQQFGPSLPGTGGIAPVLGAVGPFRPGLPHAIVLTGGLGGARAILGVGSERTSEARRGGTLLLGGSIRRYALRLDGPTGIAGAGTRIVSRASTPAAFAGRTFVLQGFVIDPAAPVRIAFTNGLELRFGD